MKTPLVAAILVITQWFSSQAPAATINVINTKDNLAGSLRQAVQDANAGDTIKFEIPITDSGYDAGTGITTINLTTAELAIGRDLAIDGSGSKIVIQRSGAGGTPDLRLFNITAGTVTISTLTIALGSPASGGGGGILNAGNLTVNRCTFTTNGVGSQDGGGISNSGTLTVNDSTFSQNDGNKGSAIYNTGTLTVGNCTIRGNLSGISGAGGGIWNSGPTAHVQNSVIAGNNIGDPEIDVFGAFISDGYNFIGAIDNSTGFGEPGSHDQVGTTAAPADPGLGELRDNGGPTFTEVPNAGSPLLDQGSAGGETTDQIGLPRTIDDPAITNAGGGNGSDIGAVERDLAPSGGVFTVTTTDERSDGVCGINDCTLIEALDATNADPDSNQIFFRAGLSGTFTTNKITPGGLSIINPVQIYGGPDLFHTQPRSLTISGNHTARVMQILATVVMVGVTITDGAAANVGGAIYITGSGSLEMQNCTVSGSTVTGTGYGGGFYVDSLCYLTLTNCTVSGNTGVNGGGGVYSNGGIINAAGSTFSDNQVTSSVGGGIYGFGGFVILNHCTVSRNAGNGLRSDGADFSLTNTLVAGNTIAGTPPDVIGPFTSQGYNLIGYSDGTNGLTDGVNHDLVGSPAAPLDPGLDPAGLQNNGGPTDTIALIAGSRAIDNAMPGTILDQQDQRYFDRVGVPDIGAYEFGGTLPMTLANISTRGRVETGDNVLIGGFIVTGTHTKRVLVRAIGPSLPVAGFLANPTLELYDGVGSLPFTNDDWQTNFNKQEIIDTGIAPTNPLESAIFLDLGPGAYTAIVRGVNNGTGVALVEAYDLDRTVDSQLANISTRGLVQTGDNVLIGGFIVLGSQQEDVIVRAIGPSLPVAGKLLDPTLELHNGDGSILASNDNWRETQENEIIATGIPPANDAESAIVTTLAPGAYTAIVSGLGGTTGVALVEVYGLQ